MISLHSKHKNVKVAYIIAYKSWWKDYSHIHIYKIHLKVIGHPKWKKFKKQPKHYLS